MKKIVLMLMLVFSMSCFAYQFDDAEIFGFTKTVGTDIAEDGDRYIMTGYSSILSQDMIIVVDKGLSIDDFKTEMKKSIKQDRLNGYNIEINHFSDSKISYSAILEKDDDIDIVITTIIYRTDNSMTMELFKANAFKHEIPLDKNTELFFK